MPLSPHVDQLQLALQVLFSRWLGQIKQDILRPNHKPLQEDAELQAVMGQASMDQFDVRTQQVVK